MNRFQNKILVMGIGNYLMGDEGIGVHVAEKLLQLNPWNDVDIIDGGTGGFHLLEYFESYPNIVLIDATLDNNPVGTVRLIRPKFSADFPKAMSTHDIGLKDMVSALQLLGKMPLIHLFVISIESIQQQGIMLTAAIEAVIPSVVKKIEQLVETLQEQQPGVAVAAANG